MNGPDYHIEVHNVDVPLLDAAGLYESATVNLDKGGRAMTTMYTGRNRNTTENDNKGALGQVSIYAEPLAALDFGTPFTAFKVGVTKGVGTDGATTAVYYVTLYISH